MSTHSGQDSQIRLSAWQRTIPGFLAFLLALIMFSRVMTVLGAPKLVDFAHFAFAPFIFFVFLLSSPFVTREGRRLLVLTALLLMSVVMSTIWSGAGIGNTVFSFLILGESYMVLAMLVSYQWNLREINILKRILLIIIVTHIAISYYEWIFLGDSDDDIEGLFQNMGAGAHIGGVVALSGGIFLYRDTSLRLKRFVKVILLILAFGVVYISDAKQIVAVFSVSYLLIFLLAVQGIRRKAKYLLVTLVAILVVWMIPTRFYSAYLWFDLELILEGFSQKLSVFSIISEHSESMADYVFGYGPGHTVGKLAFMIPSYIEVLDQFRVTQSPITAEVWSAAQSHYLSNSNTGSSILSLNFLWASLFGDLGLIGVGVYIAILFYMYKRMSTFALQKFFVLNIVGFGSIFTWAEEPQYMIFMMILIGVLWQENRVAVSQHPASCSPNRNSPNP